MTDDQSLIARWPMRTAIGAVRHEVLLGKETLQASGISVKEVDRRPVATVDIPLSSLRPGDYHSNLTIRRSRGEDSQALFTGTVESSQIDGGSIRLRASGMTEFTEFGMAALAHSRLPPMDLIYMLARTSGLPDERIKIDVGSKPRLESFEVIFPVLGCNVASAARIGLEVSLIPPRPAHFERFEEHPHFGQLAGAMQAVGAWAVTYVSARRVYEAEQLGRRNVIASLALLTAALRDGSTVDFDGRPRGFDRARSRALPEIGGYASVTGLLSRRAWLRDTNESPLPITIDGTELPKVSSLGLAEDDASLPALVALARAANESVDPLIRLTAIWEALEYYSAGVEPSVLFSKAERRAIRAMIPEGASHEKRDRIVELLQGLNTSPLMARLAKKSAAQGVELTRSDWDQLRQLRDARNNAVHGRLPSEVSREQLEYGVSIVARLLVQDATKDKKLVLGVAGRTEG